MREIVAFFALFDESFEKICLPQIAPMWRNDEIQPEQLLPSHV
jgi:hypothetical protein